MSEKPKKSGIKYKGWLIAAGVVLLLLVSVRWSLKSDWMLQKAEQIAESQATELLNGSVAIGDLQGDL